MTTRRKIQLLLWAYFWLIIFEGALRKWFFPGLSTPLLLVRDPIAIAAIALGLPYLRSGPWRIWTAVLWWIAGAAVLFAMTVGHGDFFTAAFGARILIFHLPLIFLFAAVFDRNDVWRFAKATLLVVVPMTILIGLQYSLPQSHFINVAPGGEGSAGFRAALGKFRPPGTFSFVNGLTHFYALACCLCMGWLASGPRPLPKWIWASVGGLIFALPLSVSRTLLFSYVLTFLSALAGAVRSGRAVKNLVFGLLFTGALLIAASQSALFQDAQRAFEARWEEATEAEGGEEGVKGVLQERVANTMLDGLLFGDEVPLLGKGIGLGTNVGAMRFQGKRGFLVAEAAWPATVGELGPFLGLILLGWRVLLALKLLGLAWRSAGMGNILPFILCSTSLYSLVLIPTGQPTNLGFIALSAGLTLAACNPTNADLARRRSTLRPAKSMQDACAARPRRVPAP